MAHSLANAGEVARAEEYYRRAINVATSPFERTMAQRSFAFFLFSCRRFEEARALYRDALSQLPESDPFTRQANGYTLQGWAWNEAFVARNPEQADQLFAQAQAEYAAVENPMMRNQLLNALAAVRQGTPPAPNTSPDAATGLREWLKKVTS